MCYVVDSAGLGVPNETRVFLMPPLVHKVLQESEQYNVRNKYKIENNM